MSCVRWCWPALAAAATACAPWGGSGGAWVRLDLTDSELWLGGDGASPSRVVAQLYSGPSAHLRSVSGTLPAVEVGLGSPLEVELELGRSPFLSFVPLGAAAGRCRLQYDVLAARPRAPLRRLARFTVPPRGEFLPQTREVDLAPHADSRLRLALAVAAEKGCDGETGRWGSPAVYHRVAASLPPEPSSPHVVLVTLDALRAGSLGSFGARPALTPALDALARESDVWLRTFATANGTNPSLASLMTGLYAREHGLYDLSGTLAPHHETLAEILGRAGYRTGAVVSAGHLAPGSGLDAGFDDYRAGRFAAGHATDQALDWIQSLPADGRSFFLWLHLYDPHTPHTPPEPFARGRSHSRPAGMRQPTAWTAFRPPGPVEFRKWQLGAHEHLYAGEVAYVDRQLDRLIAFLRSRRVLDAAILVLTADHGENLLEREPSFRHGGLWDATLHVPLLIRWPDAARPGRRLGGLVQTIDVFPTLLGKLGLPLPPQSGRPLVRQGAPTAPRDHVFAEHMHGYGAMVRDEAHLYFALRSHPNLDDGARLYDLAHDPAQLRNVAAERPAVAERYARMLERWLADSQVAEPPRPLSEEERERLRALGYLGY